MTHTEESALPHRTSLDRLWIVVADGGVARVLAVSEDRTKLEVLREAHSAGAHMKTHDLVSDRQGRSFESASPMRHGIASRHDPHVEQERHFIHNLAEMLNQDDQAHRFDQLILIVTPVQKKQLHDGLKPATAKKVVETIAKDLTKESPHDLWERLAEAGLMPARAVLPHRVPPGTPVPT